MTIRIGPYFPLGRPGLETLPVVAGLTQWLRADKGLYQTTDTSSPVTTNGQTVGLWQDQSGNGNHATQASSGLRPTYASSVAAANNRQALSFDNSNDTMTTTNATPSTLTIFVVWACADTAGNHRAVESNTINWFLGTNGSMAYYSNGGVKNSAMTNNQFYIEMVNQDTGVGTLWKDGTQIAGTITAYDPVTLLLGDATFGQPTNGYIAEVIVFNSTLSSPNRKLIEGYLGTRYNISVPP